MDTQPSNRSDDPDKTVASAHATGLAASRQRWHDMLDRAMDETHDGDSFLPQFVRLMMLGAAPSVKDEPRGGNRLHAHPNY